MSQFLQKKKIDKSILFRNKIGQSIKIIPHMKKQHFSAISNTVKKLTILIKTSVGMKLKF